MYYLKGGINEIAILFWSLCLFKVSGLLTKKVFCLSSGFSIFLSCNCLFRLLMGFLPFRKCYSNRSNFLFFDLEQRLFLAHNVFDWNTITPTLGIPINWHKNRSLSIFYCCLCYIFVVKGNCKPHVREICTMALCQRRGFHLLCTAEWGRGSPKTTLR